MEIKGEEITRKAGKDKPACPIVQEIGDLVQYQYRVYRDEKFNRGQFHLVARRKSDNSLVYINPVMVDQLG